MRPGTRTERRDRIYLVGFMAVGKTTIGSELARDLGYRFVDLDRIIESREGMNIPMIFERFGEASFRDLEHQYLVDSTRLERSVVATGGGAMTFARNRDVMREAGFSVWLDTSLETILERLRRRSTYSGFAQGRPMAHDEEQTRELFRSRRDAYRMADLRIEPKSGESARHVAGRISLLLRENRCVI